MMQTEWLPEGDFQRAIKMNKHILFKPHRSRDLEGRIDKEKPKTRRVDRTKTPNKSAEAAQVKLVEKVAVSIRPNRNIKNFAKAHNPGTKLTN